MAALSRRACRRSERTKVHCPTTDDILALADAMPDWLQAIVTLMAGTGLRPGEALAVTVDRVDFQRRTLRVDRQLLPTHPPSFGPPKTSASVRTVPLPQVVRDLLAAHLQRFGAGEHDLIFHDESGGALNRDRVNDTWRRAQAATGKTARMHDCRHYYARVLIAHGANVKVVQARLGQASAKETLDMYANQWPDSEDETRNAVDAEFGSPADSLRTTTWS